MKYIFVLLIIISGVDSVNAQMNKKFAQDTIIWNKDSMLVKADFQAKHPKGQALAQTSTAIFIHSELKGESLMFYVEAIFSKSKSYMKEESPYVLKHEQQHFNLTEIYSRKLRQLILEKDFTKVKDVRDVIQKMANKTIDDLGKEELKYDSETQNGLNSAKQKLWNEKIESQLSESEKYSSIEIDIANK